MLFIVDVRLFIFFFFAGTTGGASLHYFGIFSNCSFSHSALDYYVVVLNFLGSSLRFCVPGFGNSCNNILVCSLSVPECHCKLGM